MHWRAWDADGRQWSSDRDRWEDLPDTLQVVVEHVSTGRIVHTGGDDRDRWFIWTPWGIRDDCGPRDEVAPRHPDGVLKRGSWASDEVYSRVTGEAYASQWP